MYITGSLMLSSDTNDAPVAQKSNVDFFIQPQKFVAINYPL
ncbi:MAG: hypothetical protein ACI8SA_002524 [Dokdonia sp.]|jgi:hypothetical protein